METTRSYTEREDAFGPFTRMLAAVCHNCNMCGFADKKPGSTFGRLMSWQRSWCPGWAARSRVYADESIESDTPFPPSECDYYDDAGRDQ
jgi:hypothetical protein